MTQPDQKLAPPSPGLTRRQALQGLAATAAPWGLIGQAQAAIAGNNQVTSWAISTAPTVYQAAYARRFTNPFFNPLNPTAFGAVSAVYKPDPGTTNVYTITTVQGTQAVLGIPGVQTRIWGYSNYELGPTFPGRTFEVRSGAPVTVRWRNGLSTGATPLPHILPVDQTITIQTPTTGVPIAVHHHGGDTAFEFDGTPYQWQTPSRQEIGPGLLADNSLKQLATDVPAVSYTYDNNQEASLHWYHDHAESVTRINVAAGLAGLYVVRDANEDSLIAANVIPGRAHELAMVLQDRTFDANGQLTYTANPVDYPVPLAPTFPRNMPTHMPEQFGDVICVNGLAWPVLKVEPRPYRVRLLNGSDSRFYTLNFGSLVGVYQIGTDLGLLNTGRKLTTVTIAPGERMDLVLDFGLYRFLPQNVSVTNSAPTPFPGGVAPVGGAQQVMRFSVTLPLSTAPVPVASRLPTTNLRPLLPALPAQPAVPPLVRRIMLGEGVDKYGRITPLLGTYDPAGGAANAGTLSMHDPITERPLVGTTELWEFWNTTVDAHPMHMHLVQFRVLNRQAFTGTLAATVMANGWSGVRLQPKPALGAITQPPAGERGWKDTVICPPGQVTRVVVQFNRPGTYVYHCHILSHEEHDMMRFYQVIDPATRILPDGLYTIRSLASNKVADVNGGSTADGAAVIQWPAHGGKNQQWQLKSLGNGEYSLQAVHSGKLLEVSGSLKTAGAPVVQWTATGAASQRWRIEDLGNGTYRIVNVNSGLVLDVSGASTADGAKIIQWPWHGQANQRWKIDLVI